MTEREQIEEWFFQYYKDLYHFLTYYTNTHEVDDLIQETFIKAIKGLKAFKMESSPKTWLFSIARNVAYDSLRKKKRVNNREFLTDIMTEKNGEETPEQKLFLNETKKEIYTSILKLRRDYQDVIILRAIKEFSVNETALILKWSEGKVRVTFHRALKALEKEMSHLEK